MMSFDLIYVNVLAHCSGEVGTVGKYWVVVVRWLGDGGGGLVALLPWNTDTSIRDLVPLLCVYE